MLSYLFKYRLLQRNGERSRSAISGLSYLFKYRLLQPREVFVDFVNNVSCHTCSNTGFYNLEREVGRLSVGCVVIPVQIQASTTATCGVRHSNDQCCHTCSNTGFYNFLIINSNHIL